MTQPSEPPTGPSSGPSTGPASEHEPAPAPAPAPKDPLRSSRTSGIWIAIVAMALLLLLLVIFILQNTQDVQVSFLGWEGRAPLAVSLLIAAIVGILLTAVAGSLRILQLRRRIRHSSRH